MNIRPKIKLVLDEYDKKIADFYIKTINTSLIKLAKFFPIQPNSVKIYIFQNRNKFLEAIGKKDAPKWLIGHIPNRSTSSIYFFYDKSRKKDLPKTTTHELAHLFINLYNPDLPVWAKEGLCFYLAKQFFSKSVSIQNWKKIAPKKLPFQRVKWQTAVKNNGYNTAGLLILLLVKRFTWKNLLKALKSKNFTLENLATFVDEKTEDIIRDFKKCHLNKN
jgi:hypothetical protein